MKKVTFYTLGCKLNFAETSYIGRLLVANGFSIAGKGEKADVCIVNTCSVTDTADKKCRQAIHKISSANPNAFVIVTGCYAQINPAEVEQIEGVDLVLGAKEKFDILKIMHSLESKEQFDRVQVANIRDNNFFEPIFSAGDRTRYFLKVQDGCNYYCTYCTIPFARGKSRSASVAVTMDTIRRAITEGAREIILTGVNIGDFGNGSSERFIDLVRSIDDMTDEVRFRISSVEPNLLEDDIIRLIARSRRIAPHFHIPLQSGSNRVLELMQRRYTREVFAQKVATIKSLMPHAFIGVDVIVGMRGETPDMFDETVQFLAETPFSELHIFPYSEREGTRALNIIPVVSVQEKKRRSEILHRMSQEHVEEFYRSQKGLERTVLWETTKDPKTMSGYTENYIPVTAPLEADKINTFQKIRID